MDGDNCNSLLYQDTGVENTEARSERLELVGEWILEIRIQALEYEAKPLTPTLSPLRGGEGDGRRGGYWPVTSNRTRFIAAQLTGRENLNAIGPG